MFASKSTDILSLLKTISFCLTSLLALLGLMYEFKDEKGSLSKWGRANLCGLLLVFVVGIAAQRKEDSDKHAADAERHVADVDAKNQMTALQERSLQIIKDDEDARTATNTLIDNTVKSLVAQAKTDADTQKTLLATDRNMELVGETITAAYQAVYSLSDDDRREVLSGFHNLENKYSVDNADSRTWAREHTEYYPGNVIFDSKSPIVSKAPDVLQFMQKPPFFLEIYAEEQGAQKSPPKHSPRTGVFVPPIEAYLPDFEEIEARSKKKSDEGIYGLMAMRMETSGGNLQFGTPGPASLRRSPLYPGLFSAVDFGGKYLVLSVPKSDANWELCSLTLTIGRHRLVVPVNELKRDFRGEYSYKFPASMAQTMDEAQHAFAAGQVCINQKMHPEPHVPTVNTAPPEPPVDGFRLRSRYTNN